MKALHNQKLFTTAAALLHRWTWQMAWRDSRPHRGRLLLFALCIALGVGALVAIGSFRADLQNAVEEQAKSLLGADLVIGSREPFSAKAEELFRSLGGEQAREIAFSSMIYFPKTQGTRLAQIRGIDPGFPFYGKFETDPGGAANSYQSENAALVEESLLAQLNAASGDQIRVGQWVSRVAGSLQKVPGENFIWGTIAPRVYVPLAAITQSGLIKPGSLVHYRMFFKFPTGTDVEQLTKKLSGRLRELRLSFETVEGRKRNLGRALDHWQGFMGLAGLAALLLGGIGIGSALSAHLRQKVSIMAMLRCIGTSAGQAGGIFLAQAIAISVTGALMGGMLGVGLQALLPRMLAKILPLNVQFALEWPALAMAAACGAQLALAFALWALKPVFEVPALAALRSSTAAEQGRKWQLDDIFILLLLAGSFVEFGYFSKTPWRLVVYFTAGAAVFFLIISGIARLMMRAARSAARLPPSMVCRHGLANLHRPGQRTVSVLVSLGLGACLLGSLRLIQENLSRGLVPNQQNDAPNLVFFDIQSDQLDGLEKIFQEERMPLLQQVPIVTMRLGSINGRPVSEIGKQNRRSNWAIRHEYRSTFRGEVTDSEEIVAGKWIGRIENKDDPAPISVEEGVAKELEIGLGDRVEFQIQGVPVSTVVASLRKVDWRRLQPNFFVVFPLGVLEDAPAFYVFVTRAPTKELSAQLQRRVVKEYPNVSSIDLSLVLRTIDSVLAKVALAIRWMAWLVAATGVVILISALATSGHQRLQDAVLLRTIGAKRSQILMIQVIEFASLGMLAAVLGAGLAVVAAWGLLRFVFQTEFAMSWLPIAVTLVFLPGMTVLIGLAASWKVTRVSPLSILRAEAW